MKMAKGSSINATLDDFEPLYIVFLFSTQALVLLSQNLWRSPTVIYERSLIEMSNILL